MLARRVDGAEMFDRDLASYAAGFGSRDGNFWLGLDVMSLLAQNLKSAVIRVDMTKLDGRTTYSKYYDSTILPADQGYQIGLRVYSGMY